MFDINWHPKRRELRRFGLAALVVFGGLGAWAWFGSRLFGFEVSPGTAPLAAGVLWVAAAACGLLAAAWPRGLGPLYVVLSLVAWPIGWVVSHVLLAAVFYGVVTPVGLVMRLIGRDPLQRRFDPDAETYWTRREPAADITRYFRQF